MNYRSKVKLITAIDVLFLFLLCVSGSSDGIIANLIYYSAFAFPIFIGIYFLYSPNENGGKTVSNIKEELRKDLSVSKKDFLKSAPFVFPAILLIMLLSESTSLVLENFGLSNDVAFEEPFLQSVFIHALLPAILEEFLFRFIPINLLKANTKYAILLSSVMFAFAHASLFQIPYALVAGFVFSILYIAFGNVYICIALHFLNNVISLMSIYGVRNLYLILGVSILSLISAVLIFIYRKDYTNTLKSLFSGKKIKFYPEPIFFILFSLFLAISTLAMV